MKNVMVDIETLGAENRPVVISIGAVYFDNNNLGERYYEIIDMEEQVRLGRNMNVSTVKWWMEQSPDARAIFKANKDYAPLIHSMSRFAQFLNTDYDNVKVWGNGSDFDNVIVGDLYGQTFQFKRRAWKYSNNRCYRTFMREFESRAINSVNKPQREGTHHNALDDAIYQVKCIQWVAGAMGHEFK